MTCGSRFETSSLFVRLGNCSRKFFFFFFLHRLPMARVCIHLNVQQNCLRHCSLFDFVLLVEAHDPGLVLFKPRVLPPVLFDPIRKTEFDSSQ